MTGSLRVSTAAVNIRRYSTLMDFRDHADELVKAAVAAHSQLLLLPELLCVGLLWSDQRAASTPAVNVKELYRRVLNPQFSDYCEVLSDLARRHQVAIAGASYWHEREGKAVNTALCCRPDGSVGYQDKLHPTRPERAIDTAGGDEIKLFEVNGVKIAMIVCYDVQFPELSRKLVDAGADVILVPSLTDMRGYWRVRLCAQARAIENQVFTCVSPLVGNLGIPFDRSPNRCGRPLFACPIDNRFNVEDGILLQGAMDTENLVHATLDFEMLQRSRTKSEITQRVDRRAELYARPVSSA
jgi:predicted amidohydrolase